MRKKLESGELFLLYVLRRTVKDAVTGEVIKTQYWSGKSWGREVKFYSLSNLKRAVKHHRLESTPTLIYSVIPVSAQGLGVISPEFAVSGAQ